MSSHYGMSVRCYYVSACYVVAAAERGAGQGWGGGADTKYSGGGATGYTVYTLAPHQPATGPATNLVHSSSFYTTPALQPPRSGKYATLCNLYTFGVWTFDGYKLAEVFSFLTPDCGQLNIDLL